MRAPRIKGKFWGQNLSLKKAEEPQNAGCSICRRKCVDEKRRLLKECDRLTRSATRWLKDMNNNTVIIYETYRCMPLLGDENVHAPDWEEHIVRYHIVFIKKNIF